jgi:hypothetical protein
MKSVSIVILIFISQYFTFCTKQEEKLDVESYNKLLEELKTKYQLDDKVVFTPLTSIEGKELPSRNELEELIKNFKTQIEKEKQYNLEEKKFQELLNSKKPKSEYEIMKLMDEFPLLKSETIRANGGKEEWDKKLETMKKSQRNDK